jgi:hypothetical protein
MSDVRFRAFDKKNDVMLPRNGVIAMIEFNEKNDLLRIGVQEFDVEEWHACTYECKNIILLQSTGISNKSGPVWDGDILKDVFNNKLHIVFRVPGGFAIRSIKDEESFYSALADHPIKKWATENTVTVGNVHQHPNLLKEGE